MGFSIVGGQPTLTTYNIDVAGQNPMERPGLDDRINVRNADMTPCLMCLQQFPEKSGWDDHWEWKERRHLDEVDALAGSAAQGALTLTVSNGNRFTPRDVCLVNFQYHFWVTSITGNVLTGTWIGTGPPGGLPAATPVVLIGSSYYESDTPNIGPYVTTSEFWNAFQIQVDSVKYTTRMENGNYYFDNEAQYAIKEAGVLHQMKLEKTHLVGERSLVPAGASPTGTMRGVWFWGSTITSNGGAILTRAGVQNWILNWSTSIVDEGGIRRMVMAPTNVMRQLGDIFWPTISVTDQGTKRWGINVRTVTVAGVDVDFVRNPMLDIEGWTDKMIGLRMGPGTFTRVNHRDSQGITKFSPYVMPYGTHLFTSSGGYHTDSTLMVVDYEKNIALMDDIYQY